MRGVKGCFFCGRDHLENEKHSRDEVKEAVRKLKAKNQTALITVEDLVLVTDTLIIESDDEKLRADLEVERSDDEVQEDEKDKI